MYLLANRIALQEDAALCWFSGRIAFSEGNTAPTLKWHLKLRGESGSLMGSDSGPISLGVHCSELEFDVTDWSELAGRTFDNAVEPSAAGFFVYDWENLIKLRIMFGAVHGNEIGIVVEGIGSLESAPELFGDTVEFRIETTVTFSGIFVDVPLNTREPLKYSTNHLARLLPRYRYAEPNVIEGSSDGRLWQLAVHFPPASSGSSPAAPRSED